jgi:glutamate racemase
MALNTPPDISSLYKRIGLFDSGVGGLSVLRRLLKAYPDAAYYYLGDTARLPYGNRSQAEIQRFVREIVSYFGRYDLDAIVMACNTSAALALDTAVDTAVETRQNAAVLDLIAPTAARLKGYDRIGILATIATTNSQAFQNALAAHGFAGIAQAVACPQLVPLIESGRLGDPDIELQLDMVLREYLRALAGSQVIVLGCTHFPFIADRIENLVRTALKNLFPPAVRLIDPADLLVEHMQSNSLSLHSKSVLSKADFGRAGLDQSKFDQVSITFDCTPDESIDGIYLEATGDIQSFAQSAGRCIGSGDQATTLGRCLRTIRQVSLHEMISSVKTMSFQTSHNSQANVLSKS